MPEKISRWLAAAEGLVIGIPATIAWLMLAAFLGIASAPMVEPVRDALVMINLPDRTNT